MVTHMEKHPLAGKTVKIKPTVKHHQFKNFGGADFILEDWWDHLTGGSWMDADGNPAALMYALRTGMLNPDVPTDNEVVYGHVGHYGHLLHISELELPT